MARLLEQPDIIFIDTIAMLRAPRPAPAAAARKDGLA
jgi:hypothetical protein